MANEIKITFKAIDAVKNDPKKLKRFIISPKKQMTVDEYISTIAYRSFTLAKLDNEHRQRFARFIQLTQTTTADFGYLCTLLAESAEFKNYDFKINPILELYEDLLRENWKAVKTDRDTLDAIDAFDKTPSSNVKICQAIATFLKEYVLIQSHNSNID